MSAYAWPSREEWAAKAEYAVRTFCTPDERLEQALPGANWMTLSQEEEMETLATAAAKSVRPLLTAEIARLRLLLPDRPARTHARGLWFVELEGERYEAACNLGALEEMRRSIARAVRQENWVMIAWETGRLCDHYPAVTPPTEVAEAVGRMRAIDGEVRARRTAKAAEFTDAAVAAEIERRASDAGWEQELERRARIDGARNGVTIHRIGATA